MTNKRPLRLADFVEWAFAISILILIARSAIWFYWWGYLPQPFFYEPSDTFMDWFNTAYWSHNDGPYDTWGSIYPPLSFVFIRFLSIPKCYADTQGLEVRDCDWAGPWIILAIYLLNCFLIFWTYFKTDRRTWIPRSIALAIGMPMLFALERGNILLLCFTFFILGFGPLIKRARTRWLFVGLAVNMKVYLLSGIIAQLLRRRWIWTEGALLFTVGVYLASLAILGVGSPQAVINNIIAYSGGFSASQVLDMWYSVTYMPLTTFLEGRTFPVLNFVDSRTVDIGLVFVWSAVTVGRAFLVLAAIATFVRPEVVPLHRVTVLGLTFALISSEAGGYTVILVLFFVLMERWKGIARPLAICTSYIMCLPGDILVGHIPPITRFSYLAGRTVEVHMGVGLGVFARPGLLILIGILLSIVTIKDVWKDIQLQGWSDRWRFRRDWPLLPGVLRPSRGVTHSNSD